MTRLVGPRGLLLRRGYGPGLVYQLWNRRQDRVVDIPFLDHHSREVRRDAQADDSIHSPKFWVKYPL